jgi:hypothetical protein
MMSRRRCNAKTRCLTLHGPPGNAIHAAAAERSNGAEAA